MNVKDIRDCSLLHAAVETRGMKNIVKLLLENGADVNATDGSYGNALFLTTMTVLCDRYEAPEKADNRTARPLDKVSTMKLLLKAGADVHVYNLNDAVQCSPLGLAAMTSSNTTSKDLHGMVVRTFIEAGANINEICNAGGERPLQVAARRKNEQFVKWLLNHNAIIHDDLGSWRAYKKRYQTTETIARSFYEANLASEPIIIQERIYSHSEHSPLRFLSDSEFSGAVRDSR